MIKELWAKVSSIWFILMLIVGGFFFAIDNVFGAVLEDWSVSQNRYRYDEMGTLKYSDWVDSPHTWEPDFPVQKLQFRMKSKNGLSVENTYVLEFGFRPNPDSLGIEKVNIFTNVNDSPQYEDFTCGSWNKNSNGYYMVKCSFNPLDNISSNTYLYAEVFFHESYQTSFRPYMYGFEERKGTNAVITEQSNNIINNNKKNTNNIINNNNQNTQEIINNNNQNTQDIINSQTENQKVCSNSERNINNSNISITNTMLNINGEYITSGSGYGITDYIELGENAKIKVIKTLSSTVPSTCFYTINKTLIKCYENSGFILNTFLTIPNDSYFVRFSINSSSNAPVFLISSHICKNGNQAMTDALTDDNVDAPNSSIEDMQDMLPSNGVITQLIGLPITLYNKVLTSINGTCSQFDLGALYGHNLIIPCIDVSNYLGTSIWNIIDLIISGAFVLIIAKKMIKAFENFTSMKEGDVINND